MSKVNKLGTSLILNFLFVASQNGLIEIKVGFNLGVLTDSTVLNWLISMSQCVLVTNVRCHHFITSHLRI